MWSAQAIISTLAHALRAADALSRTEQAVHGIDALRETGVHPLLSRGLADSSIGVLRERPYPSEWRRKARKGRPLVDHAERLRCDLVLTPGPGQELDDRLMAARQLAGDRVAIAGTLFEPLAESGRIPMVEPPVCAVAAADAYWLEVKCIGQFTYTEGVPGPNRTYSSELLRATPADLRKVASDRDIVRGGVLLVHFSASAEIADHDIAAMVSRCIDRGLVTSWPAQERFAILDRIGNSVCTLALVEPTTMREEPVEKPASRRRKGVDGHPNGEPRRERKAR